MDYAVTARNKLYKNNRIWLGIYTVVQSSMMIYEIKFQLMIYKFLLLSVCAVRK